MSMWGSLGLAATLAPGSLTAAPPPPPPPVVPAVRCWTRAPGTLRLGERPRVVVAPAQGSRLAREAHALAAGLGGTATTDGRTRPGDVVLTLTAPDPALGREGYVLRIGSTVRIDAPTGAGIFYGGRTLLQLRRLARTLPRGTARDRPRYPERGLSIDVGRRFYSRAWLEARGRRLAALKLNLLHLHLSDDQGFRIESRTHPEVVTRPALSRADVRALVAYAARRHVVVVPEIDAPGHMRAALAAHPGLRLPGTRDKLDVTRPAARALIGDLIDELTPLFPGRYWHTGADEYLASGDYARHPGLAAFARRRHGPRANGPDAVLDFVNWVGARVRAHGKELRVWSDGVRGGRTVRLDRRTIVEWWENRASPTPAELVAAGHRVLNVGWWPLYYVAGGPAAHLRAPLRPFWTDWRPWRFEGPYTDRWSGGPGAPLTLRHGEPRQLGATLAVWNDDPAAPAARPESLARGIAPRLAILAQRTWGSPAPDVGYVAFARRTWRALGP
jgi:hexosaminidase